MFTILQETECGYCGSPVQYLQPVAETEEDYRRTEAILPRPFAICSNRELRTTTKLRCRNGHPVARILLAASF